MASVTEGVYRENLGDIPVPKPLDYHNYCQICNEVYENFDDHIASDQHQITSKHQANLSEIDNLIDDLNDKKCWANNARNLNNEPVNREDVAFMDYVVNKADKEDLTRLVD